MYKLLNYIAQALNLKYSLIRPPDHLWGVGFPNGSWNGMLGMVKRREVDMALGPFALEWERYHYACEFSHCVFTDFVGLLLKRPKVETDIMAFVKPFHWQTWLCLIAATIIVWLTLLGLHNLEKRVLYGNGTEHDPPSKSVATANSSHSRSNNSNSRRNNSHSRSTSGHSFFLWVFRTITLQSNSWHPNSDSGRIVALIWMISSLILMLGLFSGTLTAMLSVPMVQVPVDSMEDLVNQNEIEWAIPAGSFLYQMFYAATSGIYKRLFDGHKHLVYDCHYSRANIKNGKYAALCDSVAMEKILSEDFTENGECNFYKARERFKSMPVSFAFPKNHHLIQPVNK
ncbi:unnamed protein product, partial [Meganyctiphanes norvegica]